MAIELDRIEIESAGADPARLAAAIIKQLPDLTGPVPIYDIARALDIDEIREERLNSFEACLLTDRHKSHGSILVNAASSPRRRRYSVGHELGHFLNERHVPTSDDGFRCTKDDMAHPRRAGQHLRQEAEANTFAIELLAPEKLIRPRLKRAADLEHALAIADRQDISREAAVRRYVALHDECLAVVFTANGRVRYIEKSKEFPHTCVWTGDAVPVLPRRPRDGSGLTTLDEVSAALWLSRPDSATLFAQTLYQVDGHAMMLLMTEREEHENDGFDPC
jgi:hypothetical protein